MFRDRNDAGKQLAKKLAPFGAEDAIILALPRGGVVTGYEVARALSLPLDIIAVRKVGHPDSPEYAIGAVDERGTTVLNEAESATIEPQWLANQIERQRKEAKRRSTLYRGRVEPIGLSGRIAIIVDDGIATGLTMRLAVRFAKTQRPSKIVVAVPVAPPESIRALEAEGADEVIVLEPPEEFLSAVGSHYVHFDQVEDGEVVRLMNNARRSCTGAQ